MKLNRVGGIIDADWALLEKLWFWLITKVQQTHTFCYLTSEMPAEFRVPLERWIFFARGRRGAGAEPWMSPQGEVTRVNVSVDAVSEFPIASPGAGR
jgi:hypothetical protein